MNEASNHTAFFRGLRQTFGVTLILLFLCGLLFPVLLTGISAAVFPEQAGGSLVYADGRAVGSKYVGQEFTKPYFMKGRPSAYHYNTYYEDAAGNQYYHDGSPFAGVASGSNNYAPSNPALVQRVRADVEKFLASNPDVKREDIPTDLMTALRLRTGPPHLPGIRRDPAPGHRGSLRSESRNPETNRGGQHAGETSGDLRGRDGQCSRRQPGHCPGDGPDKH